MSANPNADHVDPGALHLRAPRPRVVRLSRKVLAGLAAAASIAVGGALIFALQVKPHPLNSQKDLYSTDARATADGLAALPKDYAQVPKKIPQLGPPLPGDLGRPMLGSNAGAASFDVGRADATNPQDAWETSKLFAASAPRGNTNSPPSLSNGSTGILPVGGSSAADQNLQEHKEAFVQGEVDRRSVSSERIENTPSPYVVQAGAVIAAALITGIRSDLPGEVTAQVTENVYDSPTGRFLLIPQGARLIGTYDSQVAFGQSRVLLVWTRMIFPDGKSIVLERLPASDASGYAGLQDGVDYHWDKLFLAAGVSSLLGVSADLGSSTNENDIARAIRNGFQDTVNQTGQQLVRRQIDVQPTLTVRPGFPVRLMINRDLVLEPYAD